MSASEKTPLRRIDFHSLNAEVDIWIGTIRGWRDNPGTRSPAEVRAYIERVNEGMARQRKAIVG